MTHDDYDRFSRQYIDFQEGRGRVNRAKKEPLMKQRRALHQALLRLHEQWDGVVTARQLEHDDRLLELYSRWLEGLVPKYIHQESEWRNNENKRSDINEHRQIYDQGHLSRIRDGISSSDPSFKRRVPMSFDALENEAIELRKVAVTEYFAEWELLIDETKKHEAALREWTLERVAQNRSESNSERSGADRPALNLSRLIGWREALETNIDGWEDYLAGYQSYDVNHVQPLDDDYRDWRRQITDWEPDQAAEESE